MSQTDRVLALLRDRGERGVNLADFSLPGVVDGGKPITRLAARVAELRDRGFVIGRTLDANGTARYTLDSEPVEPSDAEWRMESGSGAHGVIVSNDGGDAPSRESRAGDWISFTGLFDGAAFGEPGWKDVA